MERGMGQVADREAARNKEAVEAEGPGGAKGPSKVLVGTLMGLAGGTLWGINGTVASILMTDYGVGPVWLVCMRELLACWLFLLVAHLRTPGKVREVLGSPRALRSVLAVSLGSILFSQVAYIQAIHATNSATATVLQSLNVLIVMVYVCLVNRRLPRRRELVGMVLATVGTYLIVTGGDIGRLQLPPLGLFWGLMTAAAAAILSVQPLRPMARWGNFTVNGLAFLISGVLLAAFAQPWAHMPVLDARGWGLLFYTVVLGTFGAYGLYLAGVNRVGSIRGTMLGTSEPVMATISTVLLMGTTFTPADLAGFAMILAMVFLTA